MTHFGKEPAYASVGRSHFTTYEPYYGLKERPFSLSADPKFLYKSPTHTPVFEDLLNGIRRREGIVVLTGDIGTGKTTLCKAVLNQLDRKTFSTFIPDPFASREDLLKMLLIDFGVMSVDDLKTGRLRGASRPDLSYPLYEFLDSLVPLQGFAVLIIDEAQNLSSQLLEEIRILADLEASQKLLQVVLVGQLEFRSKLKLPEMRQLDQRVSVRCNLQPLSAEATAGYIEHRLALAGGSRDRSEFTPEAIDGIYAASRGVPRLINLICDRALHQGHLAHLARIDYNCIASAVELLGVGELTAAPAATTTAVTLANGHDSPRPLPDEDLAVHDLSDEVHASVPMQFPLEQPAPPEAGMTPEANTQPRPARAHKTATTLAEGMSVRRWRRRTRRVAIFVFGFCVLLLAVIGSTTGLPFAANLSEHELSAEPIRPPAAPRELPHPAVAVRPSIPAHASPLVEPSATAAPPYTPAAPYTIDVALFESSERSARLVERLKKNGYEAREMPLGLGTGRQQFHVVLVGNYRMIEDAETELNRIRQLEGFSDARVILTPRDGMVVDPEP